MFRSLHTYATLEKTCMCKGNLAHSWTVRSISCLHSEATIKDDTQFSPVSLIMQCRHMSDLQESCLLVAFFQSVSLYFQWHMAWMWPIFLTPNNLRSLFMPQGSSCRRRWSLVWLCSFRWRLRVFHDWTGMYDRAATRQISAPGATDGWITAAHVVHALYLWMHVSKAFDTYLTSQYFH